MRASETHSRIIVSALACLAVATLALTACTPNEPATPRSQAADATVPAKGRQIEIGNGRKIYLTCAGKGSRTVVLESGYHESSDSWMVTSDEKDTPTFDRLAKHYRVCAYDRPGTLLLTGRKANTITDRSTPVTMPRTAADVVSDLHATLKAAGEKGPYILAAHSLGGVFARLYAQTYPGEVSGVVFVDSFPIEIPQLMGDKWAAYSAVLDSVGSQPDPHFERINIEKSVKEVQDSLPFPNVPIAVLSKTEPFAGLPADLKGFTAADLENAWVKGQPYLVKLRPDTPELLVTGSDHYVHVHQPDLVAAMVEVVAGRSEK